MTVQMAADDWLLQTAGEPALRIYRWNEPSATIGYFSKTEECLPELRARSWTRRLTGGGVVLHDTDWTYALVVPRSRLDRRMRLADWYEALHRRLQRALDEPTRLQTNDGEGDAGWCFRRAVAHDLIDATGAKVAGAAIRSTREGLLVQGSIRTQAPIQWQRLAASLGRELAGLQLDTSFWDHASSLAQSRYATHGWKNRSTPVNTSPKPTCEGPS